MTSDLISLIMTSFATFIIGGAAGYVFGRRAPIRYEEPTDRFKADWWKTGNGPPEYGD